jgi:hypothetical protein
MAHASIKEDIRGNAPELRDLITGVKAPRQFWTLFNTPEALADYVAGAKGYYDDSAWKRDDVSFYGTRSMAESVDLAKQGWPEGADNANRLRDRINAANPIGPRVIRYDVAGAYPSVPRALSGNPLNMRRAIPATLKRRPVITLVSDMSSNCSVDAKALANRAAVVAALLDAIEGARFSAHVIAVGTGDSRGERDQREFIAVTAVTLKEPEQPADIGRLAFGLGHPSMLRRFCFGSWVVDQWTKPYVGMHAAYPWSPTRSDESRSIFTLPGLNDTQRHFMTEEKAATEGLALMIRELSKQGCPAFPQEADRAA